MKKRVKDERNESIRWKNRSTDVSDMQGIFRIIQSIPSPKVEPFKMWLAKVGKERIDEIIDPEFIINRSLETYLKKAIQARKELTDTCQDHGVKQEKEYVILTNKITKVWSSMTTREYKDYKGLKKENLRDNMTTTELVLNTLVETSIKDITNATNPFGLEEKIL